MVAENPTRNGSSRCVIAPAAAVADRRGPYGSAERDRIDHLSLWIADRGVTDRLGQESEAWEAVGGKEGAGDFASDHGSHTPDHAIAVVHPPHQQPVPQHVIPMPRRPRRDLPGPEEPEPPVVRLVVGAAEFREV